MIAPITEDYLYSKVGKSKNWIKQYNFNLSGITDERFHYKSKLYFEKIETGEVFVYLIDYKILLIPEMYPNLSIQENETIVYDDWYLEKGSGFDKKYTHNVISRTSEYDWDNYKYLDDPLKDIGDRDSVILKNDRIGYSSEIAVLKDRKSYCCDIYFGFPEKLELPANTQKIYSKEREIKNIILWSQRKQ